MIGFLLSPVGRYVVVALAALLLIGAAVALIYSKGQRDERNANAGRVLIETEENRKLREGNDEKARNLDDQRSLECLRDPAGCRR